MSTRTDDEILGDVAHLLSNFHGREYSGVIGPDTRFFADLGLASIDAVVFGETLEQHYNCSLPFADLMAELGTRTERDIRIGELVEFLSRNL